MKEMSYLDAIIYQNGCPHYRWNFEYTNHDKIPACMLAPWITHTLPQECVFAECHPNLKVHCPAFGDCFINDKRRPYKPVPSSRCEDLKLAHAVRFPRARGGGSKGVKSTAA